jgi:pyruvate/oxaloacetate carboxyltransferase
VKQYVKGYYGSSPAPIDEKVKKKVIGEEETITCRPADLLKPEFEKAKRELDGKVHSDEDILSYILFPQVALAFFEMRDLKKNGLDSNENALAAVATAIARQMIGRVKPVQLVRQETSKRLSSGLSPWALAGRQDLIRSRQM